MLPNHSPLVVAEQFAALEALAPGPHRPRHRTRARQRPGDHAAAAQMSGTTSDVERFPDHIRDILSLVSPDGATRAVHERRHVRRARDAGRRRCARGVAAGLERLLGAAGGIPRSAVRVREPLLGRRARARARPVPQRIPADRDAPRAADVPHGQRGRRADRRRGRGAGAPAAAHDGAAAHQQAAHRARDRRAGARRARRRVRRAGGVDHGRRRARLVRRHRRRRRGRARRVRRALRRRRGHDLADRGRVRRRADGCRARPRCRRSSCSRPESTHSCARPHTQAAWTRARECGFAARGPTRRSAAAA